MSWLRLELLAAGELAGDDAARARAHVDECPACRHCMSQIHDHRVQLRPLPAPDAATPWWRRPLAWGGFAATAAAAIAVVALRAPDQTPQSPSLRRQVWVKGNAVAVDLVRERDGSIAHTATTFSPADRFKVVITCAEPVAVEVDVVVEQTGEQFFPLSPARVTCGNRVAVPGAFRLTGDEPATVCAVVGDAPLDRAGVRGVDATTLDAAACVQVHPAR